jgi:hypothetical protein
MGQLEVTQASSHGSLRIPDAAWPGPPPRRRAAGRPPGATPGDGEPSPMVHSPAGSLTRRRTVLSLAQWAGLRRPLSAGGSLPGRPAAARAQAASLGAGPAGRAARAESGSARTVTVRRRAGARTVTVTAGTLNSAPGAGGPQFSQPAQPAVSSSCTLAIQLQSWLLLFLQA